MQIEHHIHEINKTQLELGLVLGGGGTSLEFQNLGDRSRRIFEFESSLVYVVSSRTETLSQLNPTNPRVDRLGCDSVAECLPSIHRSLDLIPSSAKTKDEKHLSNISVWTKEKNVRTKGNNCDNRPAM